MPRVALPQICKQCGEPYVDIDGTGYCETCGPDWEPAEVDSFAESKDAELDWHEGQ